ncbi:MAG: hypothetical protein AAF581_19640 [Planctomycetota bacterium]
MRAGRWALCTGFFLVFSVALLLPSRQAHGQLIWPGEEIATIEGTHLRAFVPAAHASELQALVARADQIYGHMLADADYRPNERLNLLLGDWLDAHNGFSFVVPFAMVQVELAPALTESSIFHGTDSFERTLVHELAHHISNDRTHGFRRFLENVFGRVLPSDLISLAVSYLSTPAHQTMPSFWHEGLAVWAETVYSDPASPWGGRGRDPLTHMVWRLDAAAGGIPNEADWRLSYHYWPFGRRVYNYGAAYLRYIEGHYTDRASVWELISGQSRTWPYFFARGSKRTLGVGHPALLREARRALLREQQENIAALNARPTTKIERLTPPDWYVGAPAWLPDGDLLFAVVDLHDRARLHRLAADGTLTKTGAWAHSLGNVRSDGDLVTYHEFNWRRFGRVRVGDQVVGHRLLQPDAKRAGDGSSVVVAIELPGGGKQQLILFGVGAPGSGRPPTEPEVLETTGIPWSPTLRGNDISWVETSGNGSRLLLSDFLSEPRVLVAMAGRILHPVWTEDGAFVYFCSDSSGVPNAYRFEVASGELLPITNTIGGVTACVPSPDGSTLAVVEHDHRGPFIGKIPNDPSQWVREIPRLVPEWPAPRADGEQPIARKQVRPLPRTAPPSVSEPRPYGGLRELRPLFWSPTTAPAPGGGFGVSGLASDPLLTHTLAAGIGGGPIDGGLVGFVGYIHSAWELHWGVTAWQAERGLGDQIVVAGGADFDYEEQLSNLQVRVGRGLAGLEQRFFAFANAGVQEYDPLDDTEDLLTTITPVSRPAIDGTEEYVGFTLGYGNTTFFPTSYAPEDGYEATLEFRHSGFGGDLDRNFALFNGSAVWSLHRAADVQLVAGAQVGWSDGDRTLQNNFAIGGTLSRGLPRGYISDTEDTGRHLLAGSIAVRAPLWRPFRGFSTTPFRFRQVILEVFGDTANVDDEDVGGDGDWFSSVGGELFLGWEFDRVVIRPGVGVAVQLDSDRDTTGYVKFGLAF